MHETPPTFELKGDPPTLVHKWGELVWVSPTPWGFRGVT